MLHLLSHSRTLGPVIDNGIVSAGLLAHSVTSKSSKKAGSTEMALSMIGKLWPAENERGVHEDPGEFTAARRHFVEPIPADFRSLLGRFASRVPPERLLEKTIGQALTQILPKETNAWRPSGLCAGRGKWEKGAGTSN